MAGAAVGGEGGVWWLFEKSCPQAAFPSEPGCWGVPFGVPWGGGYLLGGTCCSHTAGRSRAGGRLAFLSLPC